MGNYKNQLVNKTAIKLDHKYGQQKGNHLKIEEYINYPQNHIDSVIIKQDIDRISYHIKYYQANGNYNHAQDLIDLAYTFPQENKTQIDYLQGLQLYNQKDYNRAISFYKTLLSNFCVQKSQEQANNIHYFLGQSYYFSKKYNEALSVFKQGLEYLKIEDTYFFDTHLKIANCYFRLGDNNNAIAYLDSGIIFMNKYPEKRIRHLNHAKILQMRAYLFREQAKNDKDSVELLTRSLADSEESVEHINQFVKIQYFESDQLAFNHQFNYVFYKTIEAIKRLNSAQPDNSLLKKALYYAELDKNLALQRQIQKQKAQKELNIPKHKIRTIDSLTYAFVKNEEEIFKLDHKANGSDSLYIDLYHQNSILLTQIDELENVLDTSYPAYFKEKYKLPELDFEFITELSERKQILEYTISDEFIYIFWIGKGEVQFKSIKYDADFLTKVNRFRQLTADISQINFSDSEFKEFHELSYELYSILIKPFDSYLNNTPLLIVPDNELNLIAFEALLSEPYMEAESNYSALPYLIKSYDVAYAQSLSLLKYQNLSIPNTEPQKKVLSYAPTYNELAGNEGSQYLALRDARDNLGKLPGALAEVDYIKGLIRSSSRINTKASESSFKNESGLYTIIHCAMHALVDNENPLFSKLVFTPDIDTKEDGLLNTYEIGALDLNANLVVLSACNTAYGHINKGEGLQSISRGFIKAGCKSILSTLWSVSDATSSELIQVFYKRLSKGLSKSESLSDAKRQYLNNNTGIDAHPFYWAGYVFSGNDNPIPLQKPFNPTYWILLALIIVGGGVFFKYRSN